MFIANFIIMMSNGMQSSVTRQQEQQRVPTAAAGRPTANGSRRPPPPSLASTTPYFDASDPVETPKTPRLQLRPDAVNRTPPAPDTEENVIRQTESMFGNFVLELNARECISAADAVDGATAMSEDDDVAVVDPHLVGFDSTQPVPDELLSPEARVGRQLAVIGDDINSRYAADFTKMVRLLRVNEHTAYDGFANVARQLFSDRLVNWGRIIVLLCFGYRVVVQVVRRGLSSMFAKFFRFVVDFIVREKIASWIAAQGGWMTALRYIPETVGWPTIGIVASIAAIFVATAIYISKMH